MSDPASVGGLVRALGVELGPRPAGSPQSVRAAATIADAFGATGAAVRDEPFLYRGWRAEPVALEVGGVPMAAAACTWSLPSAPGGSAGTLRSLGQVPILPGLFEAPGFAVLSEGDVELARVYVNPLDAPAAVLPAGRGPSLTGCAAWVGRADGARLAQAVGEAARIEIGDGAREMRDANVIAEVAGSGDGVVIACAHYDSAWWAPGIVDNAAGVEWVRRVLERVAAGPRPRRTLRAVAWAAEEIGLIGARRHVQLLAEARALDTIHAVVNVDAIGGARDLTLQASSQPHVAAAQRDAAARLAGGLDARACGPLPGSDHMPFHEVGVPMLAFGGPPSYSAYHQAAETIADLDVAVYEEAAAAASEAVLALLAGDAA
jgi:hypothetical protein